MATDLPAGRPGFRPTHPGVILRHDIEALGVTQEAFADHIGVTRQTISAVIAGRSKLTIELACKISHAIGGSPQFWANLQTAHDVWDIERKPKVAAIKKIRMSRSAMMGQYRIEAPASKRRKAG
jgi:antitoxin HigA-1